jgi:hypothetical protein
MLGYPRLTYLRFGIPAGRFIENLTGEIFILTANYMCVLTYR